MAWVATGGAASEVQDELIGRLTWLDVKFGRS